MTRYCLIGNSHLACLKQGWERIRARHPHVALTFFGAAGKAFKELTLAGHALVPADDEMSAGFRWTSGGAAEIRLDDFDCFVTVALGFNPQWIVNLARRFSYVDPRLSQTHRLVSRECFTQAITDGLLASSAARIARQIRLATQGKHIILLPQPCKSVAIMSTETFQATYQGAPEGCWPLFEDLWTESASAVAEVVGAEVLFQPVETLSHHIFTEHRFSKDSVTLEEGLSNRHPDTDFGHMNADYGALLLQKLLARNLQQDPATPACPRIE